MTDKEKIAWSRLTTKMKRDREYADWPMTDDEVSRLSLELVRRGVVTQDGDVTLSDDEADVTRRQERERGYDQYSMGYQPPEWEYRRRVGELRATLPRDWVDPPIAPAEGGYDQYSMGPRSRRRVPASSELIGEARRALPSSRMESVPFEVLAAEQATEAWHEKQVPERFESRHMRYPGPRGSGMLGEDRSPLPGFTERWRLHSPARSARFAPLYMSEHDPLFQAVDSSPAAAAPKVIIVK